MNLFKFLPHHLGGYANLAVIIILILVIIVIKVNGKIRKLAYQYIPEAENGVIVNRLKKGALDYVTRLQDSDLDERMVDVIAVLLQQIPILRFIPFSASTKYLNSIVQKAFNNIKKALDTNMNNNPVKSRISKSDLDDFLKETIESASDKTFTAYEDTFSKIEKEIDKLKSQNVVKDGELAELENLIKQVYTPNK